MHDDVNKTIWSALSWNPNGEARDILVDYARVYFAPGTAAAAADGILALENNWRGPLANHGAVEGTLLMWRRLADLEPKLDDNWRWQMCLLRADYDACVRQGRRNRPVAIDLLVVERRQEPRAPDLADHPVAREHGV